MKPIRTACAQCHGTDTQYECERGQCYAEWYQQQQEEEWRLAEEDEEQRDGKRLTSIRGDIAHDPLR